MEHGQRLFALALALLLSLICIACGKAASPAASTTEITLNEPVPVKNDEAGHPCYRLEWSRVSDAKYYEIVVYSEVDGCKSRARMTENENACTLTFLDFERPYQTDTAVYRVKVRAVYGATKVWSSVWQLAFADGVCTLTPNAADFDALSKTGQATTTQKTESLSHELPEPLTQYEAKQNGKTDIDLTAAAWLEVDVNHCEYGEPTQKIRDTTVVQAAVDAIVSMQVTGRHDEVSSTGTYYSYRLYDATGERLIGFSIQDGLLMQSDGRYDVSGVDTLLATDGVLLADGWNEYWEAYAERAREYEEGFVPTAETTLFDHAGYEAHTLSMRIDEATLFGVTVKGDENRGVEPFDTDDPAIARGMFDALMQARVSADPVDETAGQSWTVIFSYDLPDEPAGSLLQLRFVGDCLVCDAGAFPVEGLDALFTSSDGAVLTDLRENRTKTIPIPRYR